MTHHVNGGRRQVRSRAQGSIGVPPVFPIRVQDDDQKLAGLTSPRSHSPICSHHSATQARRLCYHRLGVMPPLLAFLKKHGAHFVESPGTPSLAGSCPAAPSRTARALILSSLSVLPPGKSPRAGQLPYHNTHDKSNRRLFNGWSEATGASRIQGQPFKSPAFPALVAA
jgi:hypothetical protein